MLKTGKLFGLTSCRVVGSASRTVGRAAIDVLYRLRDYSFSSWCFRLDENCRNLGDCSAKSPLPVTVCNLGCIGLQVESLTEVA